MSDFLSNAFGVFLGVRLADIFKKKPIKASPAIYLKPVVPDYSLPTKEAIDKYIEDIGKREEEVKKLFDDDRSRRNRDCE